MTWQNRAKKADVAPEAPAKTLPKPKPDSVEAAMGSVVKAMSGKLNRSMELKRRRMLSDIQAERRQAESDLSEHTARISTVAEQMRQALDVMNNKPKTPDPMVPLAQFQTQLLKAIHEQLQSAQPATSSEPVDYVLEFDRDENGRIASGIRARSVKP